MKKKPSTGGRRAFSQNRSPCIASTSRDPGLYHLDFELCYRRKFRHLDAWRRRTAVHPSTVILSRLPPSPPRLAGVRRLIAIRQHPLSEGRRSGGLVAAD